MRLPKSDAERSRLTRGVVYPLADRLTQEEQAGFGLPNAGLQVGAFAAGEYRKIRPGEWYLSGADIAAYRAPQGTDTAYQVAHLSHQAGNRSLYPSRLVGARMSKGKMTPGPWRVNGKSEGVPYPDRRVLGCGGLLVAIARAAGGPDYQAAANARAIAELPKLIEAAQAALNELDTYNMSAPAEDTTHAVAETLRAVLARIEGSEP